MAATYRPDVILLDIGMPKLNGFEAARRVRQQPWGKGILLVALTGWGQDEVRRKTAEAGFDAHLVKPVTFAALAKVLAKFPGVAALAPDRLVSEPSAAADGKLHPGGDPIGPPRS